MSSLIFICAIFITNTSSNINVTNTLEDTVISQAVRDNVVNEKDVVSVGFVNKYKDEFYSDIADNNFVPMEIISTEETFIYNIPTS